MKIKRPAVDYRRLNLQTVKTEEFRHVLLLLYWPIYGLLFLFVERFFPVTQYHVMHCGLDDMIPFCEWFLIPYLFWFVYLIGMHLYTLFYDVDAFRHLMKYIIFTYTVTIVIYFLFPTCQHLRPDTFARDNLLTKLMAAIYQFDTDTNVCPSLHVIGSMAVLSTACYSKTIRSRAWKIGFGAVAFLICLSTMFLKQHSALDVLTAIPVCIIAEIFSRLPLRKAARAGAPRQALEERKE